MRDQVRQLADEIAHPKTPPQPAASMLTVRQATVQSIQSGSVTVRYAGDATDVPGVRYLSSYTPALNDVVMVQILRPGFLVPAFIMGKLA